MHDNAYSLSIRLTSDGFSLFIYNDSGKLVSKKWTPIPDLFKLSENTISIVLEQIPELSSNYKEASIVIETDQFTLIPSVFFREEKAGDYLKLQHPEVGNNSQACYDSIETRECLNVFSTPLHLINGLKKYIPRVAIKHHLTELIAKMSHTSDNILQICLRDSRMDAIVIKDTRLQLANSFKTDSPEDLVYYVLNIFEQLSLNTEQCQVIFYNIDEHDKRFKLVNKYVKHCSIENFKL